MARNILCVLLAFVLVGCDASTSTPLPAATTAGSLQPAITASPAPAPPTPSPSAIRSPAPTASPAPPFAPVWTSPIATDPNTYLKVLTGASDFVVTGVTRTTYRTLLVVGYLRRAPVGLLLVMFHPDGQVAWQRVVSVAEAWPAD